MRASPLFILFSFFTSMVLISTSIPQPAITPASDKKKKERAIGTAWQEAVQHVYIASVDAASQQRTCEKPKETQPTPPVQPQPEPLPIAHPEPAEPSPQEIEALLANLHHIINSIDEEDDAYIYYDDASEDVEIPMNFTEFMQALHGNQN